MCPVSITVLSLALRSYLLGPRPREKATLHLRPYVPVAGGRNRAGGDALTPAHFCPQNALWECVLV